MVITKKTKVITKYLFAITCIVLAVLAIIFTTLSFFSDIQKDKIADIAGTVKVQLIENDPFDATVHPEEGYFIDSKNFRAKSQGTLDTYVRAYLKPVVEAYDENSEKWILISVSSKDIVLEITDPGNNWIGADVDGVKVSKLSDAKYYYYKKIMQEDDETSDLKVQIVDIQIPDQFVNMNIRYNLHVYVEGAQVSNSMWKSIFNIGNLPSGVEK